ncbi:potassium-transporting ATPase subunit KdpA [Mycobacterium sp. 1423905.2]|uniref:potassium-transporting ATPase subunit KdpA n=1 Tax=Mycobacterium sp. 1423905.2 TaxID=1856859 RepID=UPI0007FE2C0D|nr:potassium-transporting ATPase subunit KdpA [Mycobacterium sp. 1423905.2]OBJ57582.1 K+-transporting ATPase subunit A [Mycobacterium sp. 1423905.2]
MSTTTAGVIFLGALIAALALVHVPLGDYMYRVYASKRDSRVERVVYRLIGVDSRAEQTWGAYARSVLAFSAVSILFLFALQLLQGRLPLHLHDPATPMTAGLAWNTAVSFVTNTNWQAYSGEQTQGHLVQMAGLAVQNFVSAAVGMAVAVALVRGFARKRTGELGNFWVDLTRTALRILLPIAVIGAILLVAGGVIQNFHPHDQTVTTLGGGQQTITGGPVASQEVIKELGTNGGGFYNANSAHPFENPTSWTNWLETFYLLVISFSLPRTFGRMVGSKKQGYAIASVMATLSLISASLMLWFQLQHHGTVPTAVGTAMEGVEQRFGVADSAIFADATTLTSTGAVDSFHDSFTSLGGMMTMFNMQLGEVAPGGTGSGLAGMLILAVITVFVAGLMVGRTPEYLGKKLNPREIKLAASYFLVTPLIVLTGTATAMALPGERAGMLNTGPHGLSEVLYAFTSAANNNGSAFAGLSANTDWYNAALGLAMVFGRFLPIVLVLALAGSLAKQGATPESVGTLPTHRPQFVGMVSGVTLILVALTFLPMLALGPLAEGIH